MKTFYHAILRKFIIFVMSRDEGNGIFRCGYRISIRGFVRPSVRRSVGPSVGRSVGRSITCFFGLGKNGGKWSKMTFHFSTGFLFQSFTLNLFFTIFSHNLSYTIFLSQSFFHNLSFKFFISISAKFGMHR